MFDEQVKATFAAQARAMADQINGLKAQDYLTACQNWAIRGAGPAPVPGFNVKAVVEFEPGFSLRLVPTDTPVSDIKPEAFLTKYATDADAVGGPVGGQIPGSPGKYYAVSGASPIPGDVYNAGSAKYTYVRPTPFGGFWVRL